MVYLILGFAINQAVIDLVKNISQWNRASIFFSFFSFLFYDGLAENGIANVMVL